MKPLYSYALIAAFAALGQAFAVEATTTPVGYVSTTCLPNSDTIVGAPLKVPTVASAALISPGEIFNGDSTKMLLTVGSQAFVTDALAGTHYVKFTSGNAGVIGKIFPITANSEDALVVDLNGEVPVGATGNTISVTKFWTLKELFVPSASTTDPLTTGNAIVASTSDFAGGLRTTVLLADVTTAGVNLSSAGSYYLRSGIWKKVGGTGEDVGNLQLWPDNYFTIRNPAAVTAATKYTISGEVDIAPAVIPLATRDGAVSVKQDNPIALTRPVDVTLTQLGLGGTSAFVTSTSTFAGGRRDEILVFDNTVAAQNKSASATYFYVNGMWNKAGGDGSDVGATVIPAGYGIVIRKVGTTGGVTAQWNNAPNYTN